jgi:hypothetical protein
MEGQWKGRGFVAVPRGPYRTAPSAFYCGPYLMRAHLFQWSDDLDNGTIFGGGRRAYSSYSTSLAHCYSLFFYFFFFFFFLIMIDQDDIRFEF